MNEIVIFNVFFLFIEGTPAQRAVLTDEFSRNLKKQNQEQMLAFMKNVGTPNNKGKHLPNSSGFEKTSAKKSAGSGM